MSGGHCNYVCWDVENVAEEMTGELKLFMKDVAMLLHDYEWWKSGDTSDETWHAQWKIFKQQWLRTDDSQIEKRLKNIIKDSIKEILEEI